MLTARARMRGTAVQSGRNGPPAATPSLPGALAALLLCLAVACRRQSDQARPTEPVSATRPVPATTQGEELPAFSNSPEGAARKFLYAWISGHEAMLNQAIVPDARFKLLLAVPWSTPQTRQQQLERALQEPVREFQPGDLFPTGLPGQPKQMQPVPPDAVGPDRRLLLLAERGMFVVRTDGVWRVEVAPILDKFEQEFRTLVRPPATAPAAQPPEVRELN